MRNRFYNINHVINANAAVKMVDGKSTFVQWCNDATKGNLYEKNDRYYIVNRIADIIVNG